MIRIRFDFCAVGTVLKIIVSFRGALNNSILKQQRSIYEDAYLFFSLRAARSGNGWLQTNLRTQEKLLSLK
jgi:hypothetical protein